MKISIIGTSKITESHIKSILNNNSEIISISSTRSKSKKIKYLSRKFRIKKNFTNWKDNVYYGKKNKANFLITGRIQDNFKVLKKCCETGQKILIEKPVFLKTQIFNYFLKYKKQIFVGYNRIFYKNINLLKKEIKNKKKLICIVKCPEISFNSILTNSCHIISVLVYLFGNLRLEKKTKNKNFIICTFRSYRQDLITVYFNIKNSDNFSIEIFDKSKRYFLSPIEKLKIFKNLEKRKIFNNKVYIPKVFKEYDEIKISGRFKPGFNTQFKTFKSFNKSKKIFNDIFLAKKVMNICKEICK